MGKNMIKTGIAALLALCFFASVSIAEEQGKGDIDWAGGYVTGVGFGTSRPTGNRVKDRLNAIRAAEATAQRALLETIKGVRIDSVTTVENMALVDDRIRTRVSGVVKGAHITKRDFQWVDGSPMATVEMKVCLTGGISGCRGQSLVNVLDLEKVKLPPHVPQEPMSIDTPLPSSGQPSGRKSPVYDANRKVTGVIFNLEGRFFEKEMLPVVVTRNNDKTVTIYCVKNVKPSVIRSFGAVRYADSLDQATKQPNLGDNPLIIHISDVSRENMIFIHAEDAKIMRDTMMHGNDYLNDAKVVITTK